MQMKDIPGSKAQALKLLGYAMPLVRHGKTYDGDVDSPVGNRKEEWQEV